MGLGVVTVFGFLFFVLLDVAFFDGFEFERTGGDDFKIGAAFGAGDDFALVDFVFLKIQIGIAFRAKHHKSSWPIATP
jgi:hypothetical protein